MLSFAIRSILKVVLLGAAILALPHIFVGISVPGGWVAALIAAIILWIINLGVKPVLSILTLPINIVTLGIFGIVFNALLFWLVGYLVPGFDVTTFMGALVGSIVTNIIIWILDAIL